MRHALIAAVVMGSFCGVVERASAKFIGLNDLNHTDSQFCDGSKVLKSDAPGGYGSYCPEGTKDYSFKLTDLCKQDSLGWKDFGACNFFKDQSEQCWHHHDDCGGGGGTTPSVTPPVTPGSSVPLPPAAWGGLATLLAAVGFSQVRKPVQA